MSFKIKNATEAGSNRSEPFDIFADNIEEKEVVAGTSSDCQKANLIEDSLVKWVYKLENTDESKVNGPFTSEQMLALTDKDEFKEKGVWCRKLDESSHVAFYNSKRIDFELYT